MKKVIAFDLDGTLAESKSAVTFDMQTALERLSHKYRIVIITGGKFGQVKEQFLDSCCWHWSNLEKLHLFPTCGAQYFQLKRYLGAGFSEWTKVYSKDLFDWEKQEIIMAFFHAATKVGYVQPFSCFGDVLEDRDTQITFSACGQNASPLVKNEWAKEHDSIRKSMHKKLEKLLPNYSVRLGGSTSIDITSKGIDKAFGIDMICEHLKVEKNEIVFVGDALYEGGNDYPVKAAGVECHQVSGPKETLEIITTYRNL